MGRPRLGLLVALITVVLTAAPNAAAGGMRTRAATHTVAVSGPGLGMYPAFDPGIERYAVTTADESDGSATVTASSTDPRGTVWVNGRRADGGSATLTGLAAGDEISVIVKDSGGVHRHALYYLPVGFPTLETPRFTAGLAPRHIFLTPSKWLFFARQFEATVDRRGVPIWSSGPTGVNSADFKRQANGHYSVMRPTTTPGRTGSMMVELDQSFAVVRTWQTVGLTDTDLQSGLIRANGNAVLVAYEPNPATGKTDSVIQEQTPAGRVVFQWSSRRLADETMLPGEFHDYAHLNAIAVSRDGRDFIVTFRHLSSVMRIARVAHDGYRAGDIVWRLGGRDSDFRFVADRYPSGPCAATDATELANGRIVVYDTGSQTEPDTPAMCVDPADPAGPAIERPSTRVTEYALDTTTGVARLVWSFEPGRYGRFGGSAQRLGNGNTLVGWSWGSEEVAEEVTRSGQVIWWLRDRDAVEQGYVTYRARGFTAPDRIKPEVQITSPAPGVTLPQGSTATVDFTCTDTGGSTLATCGADGQWGSPVDTSTPGTHALWVTATDGAGNRTTETTTYLVSAAAHQPDLAIRPGSTRIWTGSDVYAPPQQIGQRLAATGSRAVSYVRVQNDGSTTEAVTVRGSAGTSAVRVRYFVGTTDVTRAVVAGTWRSRSLPTDGSVVFKVVATRLAPAVPGDVLTVSVTGDAAGVSDTVTNRLTNG